MANSKCHSTNNNKELKVKLNQPFLFIIQLLHYMGLSTLSNVGIKFKNRYQEICHLKWCLLNIFIFSIIYFLIFYYHRELFYIGDNFGEFSDFLKVSIIGITHLITLVETIRTQRSSAKFFQLYSALHQQWAQPDQTKKEFQIYKRLVLLMLFYIIVLFAVEINYVLEIHHKKQWILFFIAYMPSVMICRFRMIQISMYLFLILTEILQLNEELQILVKSKNLTEVTICKELSVFMRKYNDIYLMMELFKNCNAISFVMIFLKSYFKILSDSYWTYWVIYNQDDVYEYVEYSLVIPAALIICLTLIISKDCMNAAKLIPHSLHSLRHSSDNLQLSYKIQNFSLQIRHQQIVFDAFGCFVVDCYIVSGVLSSIATHMIFYIEFMPKFKNF